MSILVIAEHDNASIKGATLNTVTAALACGSDVHVLVAGANAGAAAAAVRAARDAAAHCDIASIEPGDTVRDRYGWNLVTRVNVTTVTVRGPFGAERIPLERIIETRKAAA